MAQLVVLLGAGASHDCASRGVQTNEELRPPLVKDLFGSTLRPAMILNSYPLAEAATAEIRTTLQHESVALEKYLRTRLRDSPDVHAQLRYRQIPLFLQDLFFTISQRPRPNVPALAGFTRHADHYDVLLNLTLPLEKVLYVTLNYDTLFDNRLTTYGRSRITAMDDYIAPSRNWALLKLHGSINWARRVQPGLPADRFSIITTQEYLEIVDSPETLELSEAIELRSHADLMRMRCDGGRDVYYPALSAPLGSEDELSCPPDHVVFLRQTLESMGPLNLLVIGYSGYDQEVLRLLKEHTAGVKSLLVANGTENASRETAARIMEQSGKGFDEGSVFVGGFGELVSTGRLQEFVGSVV